MLHRPGGYSLAEGVRQVKISSVSLKLPLTRITKAN
jgi:hypothetical protein